MARRYARDNRGRFASVGATARGGRLRTAAGNKRDRQAKRLAGGEPVGTIGKRRRSGSKSQPAANAIKPTGKLVRRGNSIKLYQPKTVEGKVQKLGRAVREGIGKVADEWRDVKDKLKEPLARFDKYNKKEAMRMARHIANRGEKGIKGRLSKIYREASSGTLNREARRVIQSRARRAAAAAARGSKPAAKAVEIYDRQLAYLGPGKPSKARNNLRPGPRNQNGTPKKRRKRK